MSARPSDELLSNRERWDSAPAATQIGSALSAREGRARIIQADFAPGGEILIATENPPRWLNAVGNGLAELATLAEGWDSYGAKRIDTTCLGAALQLAIELIPNEAPAPSVVPLSSGAVQLEWHQNGFDIEIRIRSAFQISASISDLQNGQEWEEPWVVEQRDRRRIRRALVEMTQR